MKKSPVRFSEKCYRGEPVEASVFMHPADPGDLGVGEYWTTHESTAKQYGKVREEVITLECPLRLGCQEALDLSDKYGTVTGLLESRVRGAIQLTRDMKAAGYDGIITEGYETPDGEVAITVFPDEIDEGHFRTTPRYKQWEKIMKELGKTIE